MLVLVAFLTCMALGSVLNLLLNTTKKEDWLMTLCISLIISVFVQFLNVV